MTKIKIIPHTHWDKEWYFTAARSQVYSLADFDEILDVLTADSDFICFLLDGQLSIIEEYLSWHPHRRKQLQELVKQGKLIIGPWYTQPDTLVISGENLIKNLTKGIEMAQEFGPYQSIGYLPDSFGMSGQMPQIYRQFNLQYAFFRRGTAKHLLDNREFIWEGLDGTPIFTHNLHHYGNMAYPPNESEALSQYYHQMVADLKPTGQSDIILLFNGEDQKPIRRNLPHLVALGNQKTPYQIEITSLTDALKEIETYYLDHPTELPRVKGEFTFGQFSRTHKSIFSTRADLKQMNNQLENFISNQLEPISSLAYSLGLDYEGIAIDQIWQGMLLNSAHDSIGNCNSDATNLDIRSRYIKSKNLAQELVEFKMRQLGQAVQVQDMTQFQVYNLLPYQRDGLVYTQLYSPYDQFEIVNQAGQAQDFAVLAQTDVTETYLKKSKREVGVDNAADASWAQKVERLYHVQLAMKLTDLPAFGYDTYHLVAVASSQPVGLSQTNSQQIENDFYRISFEQGQVHLLNLATKQEIQNFIRVLDEGDEGDSYDYSEPSQDHQVWAEFTSCEVKTCELYQTMQLQGHLVLPRHLAERAQKHCSQDQEVQLELTVVANQPGIDLVIRTCNQVDEHRLRLVVETGKDNGYSYADTQFGTIKRPVYLPQVEQWQAEQWDEKPRTIEPLLSYVTNGFNSGDVQIVTQDVREYQLIGRSYSQIAMTLYRSTPLLGKSDLNDRPGRESGTKAPTEDARLMHYPFEGRYTIRLLGQVDNEVTCAQFAKRILTPIKAYQAAPYRNNTDNFVLSQVRERHLPLTYSLFELDQQQILSTVQHKQVGQLLIRSYNPSIEQTNRISRLESKYLGQPKRVNLLGDQLDWIDQLGPCQFITWSVTMHQ